MNRNDAVVLMVDCSLDLLYYKHIIRRCRLLPAPTIIYTRALISRQQLYKQLRRGSIRYTARD